MYRRSRVRAPDGAHTILLLLYIIIIIIYINNASIVQWLEFVPSKHEVRVRFPVDALYIIYFVIYIIIIIIIEYMMRKRMIYIFGPVV